MRIEVFLAGVPAPTKRPFRAPTLGPFFSSAVPICVVN